MAEITCKSLTVDNLFDFCGVLDAVGVEAMLGTFDKKEIQALRSAGKNSKDVGIVIAMKVAGILVRNLSKARNEIYTFFAGCLVWENGSAVTPEELCGMKIGAFLKLLKEFFKQEDLADFFGQAVELADTEQSNLKSC